MSWRQLKWSYISCLDVCVCVCTCVRACVCTQACIMYKHKFNRTCLYRWSKVAVRPNHVTAVTASLLVTFLIVQLCRGPMLPPLADVLSAIEGWNLQLNDLTQPQHGQRTQIWVVEERVGSGKWSENKGEAVPDWGTWWRIGWGDYSQLEGRGLDPRSSRHVGTLGKSFTCSCLCASAWNSDTVSVL